MKCFPSGLPCYSVLVLTGFMFCVLFRALCVVFLKKCMLCVCVCVCVCVRVYVFVRARVCVYAYVCSCLLQLGGKNPSVVFEDANLDECVATHLR